jgi:hypothetical protein
MTQRCSTCRFWLADAKSGGFDEEPFAFGKCRRFPPEISDHMASSAIGQPRFGQQFDPEDLADTHTVYNSCLVPVTFCADWCGEFASAPPQHEGQGV